MLAIMAKTAKRGRMLGLCGIVGARVCWGVCVVFRYLRVKSCRWRASCAWQAAILAHGFGAEKHASQSV